MSKGYETRIDSIIEKVIDGNIEFNAKPMQQQNKDKEEMVESISNAISHLNDLGQKLVLDELDNRASQNSLEIFDSQGNIKVLELTHLTVAIVSSTLEYAQRQGIDLTKNSIKNEKSSEIDTILTAVMIDEMLKDYHSLSDSEKNNLIKGYSNLSDKQKDLLINGISEELDYAIGHTDDSEHKKSLTELQKGIRTVRNVEKNLDNIPDGEKKSLYIKYLEELPDDIRAKFEAKLQEEKINTLPSEQLFDKSVTFLTETMLDLGQSSYNKIKDKEEIPAKQWKTMKQMNSLIKSLGRDVEKFDNKMVQQLVQDVERQEQIMIERSNMINAEFIAGSFKMPVVDEFEIGEEQSLKDTLVQKPISIMTALSKINIPENDIRESLKIYKEALEKIDKDDIEKLQGYFGKPKFSNKLNKLFKQFGMDERISEILSKIDYEGQLLDILSNEEQREIFLQELEIASGREINTQGQMELDGEIENVLSQYFEEKAVDMYVEEPKTLTEKVGDEIGEENPIGFDDIFQGFEMDSDDILDFLTDALGEEVDEESTQLETEEISLPETERYTETLAAEEMEVEQPQVFDIEGLFDAQKAKDIFGEEGSRTDLGQAIDLLNTLGKDMQNPNKQKIQGETETKLTSLDDSSDDNR